jgi:hypothetical protein
MVWLSKNVEVEALIGRDRARRRGSQVAETSAHHGGVLHSQEGLAKA